MAGSRSAASSTRSRADSRLSPSSARITCCTNGRAASTFSGTTAGGSSMTSRTGRGGLVTRAEAGTTGSGGGGGGGAPKGPGADGPSISMRVA